MLCDLWVLAFRVYCHPGPFCDLTANHCIQLWGSWKLWWSCAYCPNKKCNKEIWYTTAYPDSLSRFRLVRMDFTDPPIVFLGLHDFILVYTFFDEMSKNLAGFFLTACQRKHMLHFFIHEHNISSYHHILCIYIYTYSICNHVMNNVYTPYIYILVEGSNHDQDPKLNKKSQTYQIHSNLEQIEGGEMSGKSTVQWPRCSMPGLCLS